ncbi:MAG: hypothetical protein ABL921_03450 [Pirellula sp.]
MKPHVLFWATVFAFSFLRCGDAKDPGSGRFPEYKFVTSTPNAQDLWPCFSPDSQRLLFTRTMDGKTWELFTVSVDDGKPSPFPAQSPMFGTRANWSAAKDLIAYNGQPSKGRFNLVVMKGDGTGLRVLVTATKSDQMSYPSWYPDGMSFAVVDFSGDEESAIKRIDIENGTVVTLTDPKTHWAGVPRVSPDGKNIVMCGQVKQGQRYSQYQNQIWFLNSEGNLRPLDSKRGWAPFWSPDGQWIVFASDRGGDDGRRAIFVASPDGKTVQQLTPPELNAGHPTWSPDGKWIAFFAQFSEDKESRGLAVVQADEAVKLIRAQ